MEDVFYAIKDIRAGELNKITDELDADMLMVWKAITETLIRDFGRETIVWQLKRRDLVILRMEALGYTCKKEFGNGSESCFRDGLRIIWRNNNAETEEAGNDI